MGRAVLWTALCVWGGASPAAADLAGDITNLLRSQGCRMQATLMAQVFATMGHTDEEVAAALDDLREAGRATVAAGRVVLSADACEPLARPAPPEVVPWIEGRMAEDEGCRIPRAVLEADAQAAGLRAERLQIALADLAALGRVLSDDGDLTLRDDLCGVQGQRDWQLDRVLEIGLDSYRAVLGVLAYLEGCRLDTTDPTALEGELSQVAREQLLLGSGLSPEAGAALLLKVRQALADPGPAFRVEPGAIVARYCLP